MKKNLQDYIKIYHNQFSKELCEQTIQELNDMQWKQHTFNNYVSGDDVARSGDKELDVSWEETTTRPELMKQVWNGINQYITKDFNYNWFSQWAGYTGIRFNRYKETRKMAEHCDHIHSMFDGDRKGIPTLSLVGILNDDYEGGEFVMFQDEVIPLKQGDLLIFPSNFMYPHRVEPVTKGVRDSFVSWVW
jgi:predicted 2-oxoglutarate/Fe(II)-dependent dioxygenase YbiX